MRERGIRRAATLAAACLAAVIASAGPASDPAYLYRLTPIASPDGATRAWAVNDAGLVVGEVETGAGAVRAFVWTRAEGLQVLGTLGGRNSRALDVNADGLVVGESETSNGVVRGFVWTVAEGLRPLPAPEVATHSTAYAVNELGQIAGSIEGLAGMHAVIWNGGEPAYLPQLPGAGHVQALDINRAGDVVGQIQTGSAEAFAGHAFAFPEAVTARNLTRFRLISSHGGSAAVALNEHGHAVGHTMLDSSRVRAFRYHPDSGFVLLPDHDALYSSGRDINSRGDIVGSCIPSYWSDELACAWIDGRWFDLNESTDAGPDWWLVQATGINRDRAVVGYGLRGERHTAFLLEPAEDLAPADWPVCILDVRELDSDDRAVSSLILSVDVRHQAPVRRVLFYENGVVIGSVDEPPYEWGWQGAPPQETEFYAEILETSGRRIRSARHVRAPTGMQP